MMKNSNVSIALVHYPATDRNGRIIVTSFTTMDLHDIARPARAYEIDGKGTENGRHRCKDIS